MLSLKKIFEKKTPRSTVTLSEKINAEESESFDWITKIQACEDQFLEALEKLSPEAESDRLIRFMTTNIALTIGAVHSEAERICCETHLKSTMHQIKAKWPPLATAVDTFNTSFEDAISDATNPFKHKVKTI